MKIYQITNQKVLFPIHLEDEDSGFTLSAEEFNRIQYLLMNNLTDTIDTFARFITIEGNRVTITSTMTNNEIMLKWEPTIKCLIPLSLNYIKTITMDFYQQYNMIQIREEGFKESRLEHNKNIKALEDRIKAGYDRHGITFTSEAQNLRRRMERTLSKRLEIRKQLTADKKELLSTPEGQKFRQLENTQAEYRKL